MLPLDQEGLVYGRGSYKLTKLHLIFFWSYQFQKQMALLLGFFKFQFFAEFLGFETNVILIHHDVTFHAPVVSSRGHDFELNFILAYCVRGESAIHDNLHYQCLPK